VSFVPTVRTRPGMPDDGFMYQLFPRWSDVVFAMKEFLVANNWYVRRSGTGDGGSFAFGDLITEPIIRNNTNCWFEIAAQSTVKFRRFVFWRALTLSSWRIAYCDNDGLGPSVEGVNNKPATYAPAAEEVPVLGGGSVAVPSFAEWVTLFTGDGITTGYRWSGAAKQPLVSL